RAGRRERVERAIGLARRVGGRCLASITTRLDSSVDPCAVVVASRATDERWFCFEQPERAASALAALGSAADLEARGTDRFSELGARWRTLVAQAIADPPDGPPGAQRDAARTLRGGGGPRGAAHSKRRARQAGAGSRSAGDNGTPPRSRRRVRRPARCLPWLLRVRGRKGTEHLPGGQPRAAHPA